MYEVKDNLHFDLLYLSHLNPNFKLDFMMRQPDETILNPIQQPKLCVELEVPTTRPHVLFEHESRQDFHI